MKNLWMLLLAAVLFVTGSAFALTPPAPTGYVTDTTGKLSSGQVAQLNQRLTAYQRQTKNEVAVVMVPSLDGDNLDDATHKVFKAYGIGKAGLDNGVLLFIALNDRKMRLQTGKGVEGEIPDIAAGDILNGLKPYFRSGDFYGGINHALDGIQSKLDNRFAEKADPGQGQQFNKPVTQEDNTVNGAAVGTNTNPNANKNAGSCSVGEVGSSDNSWGWGFGLLALFGAGILFARGYIRRREEENMRKLEAEVDAQMKAEEEAKVAAFQRQQEEARLAAQVAKVIPNVVPVPVAQTAPVQPRIVAPEPIPVPVPVVDTAAVYMQEQLAQARREKEAEERRAQARRAREAEEREEERRAQARRERLEEERAEARRREREEEEAAEAAVAAAAVVSVAASIFSDDDDSSRSNSGSGDSGFSWDSDDSSSGSDDSDSGFGGGDSGGGGSDSDW